MLDDAAGAGDDAELLSSVGWDAVLDTERDHSSTLILGGWVGRGMHWVGEWVLQAATSRALDAGGPPGVSPESWGARS